MADRKRALEGGGAAGSAAKRLKSDSLSANDLIMQKRAEVSAKLAAMKKSNLAGPAPQKAPTIAAPVPTKPIPSKLAMPPTPASSTPSSTPKLTKGMTPPSTSATPAAVPDDLARRVAEAKKRVSEAQTKLAIKDNPYMAMAPTNKKKGSSTPVVETQPSPGAGLKMAAHPLLLGPTTQTAQSKKDRYKPMQPKFASIKANVRNAPTPPPAPTPVAVPSPSPALANPYASAGPPKDGTGFDGAPRDRHGRNFRFNPKGKYVAIANQLRQEQQLEALKQRIAESARKAGLDSDMGIEKNIKRPPPPEAEWWDAALLPTKNYTDIETFGMEQLNIRSDDSPVTLYIQHPIPIPAPGDKNKAELKPLKLTTKEQKKLRKRSRKEKLQDKRDRIRMGLAPPDPPKVRLGNLMKVLTSDAIQDPTRVEARVRREVAMRKHTHEKMNAERKLTDEQRREKIESKKLDEEKKGIVGAVFKIKNLSDGAHRFKVRKNAEQNNLTGVCIFNPQFNVVYVEGAAKFIKNYKRLMLRRLKWTEQARPRGGEAGGGDASAGDAVGKGKAVDGGGSLENNKCWLIWEGTLRERMFTGFKARSCPTEREVKEVLGDLKGYWDMAKNWKGEEEELY
ncbi:hypothetical protein AGABI1DRAFT_75439 [Agaricus bisporus var. burnettii JB137-S8]|uniref:Uncharacterized protein n=1 Tax=Agaricus bisporus var. burnettii (strain JB137-S8 / ATCC MYA-4627 / FGSC 10392) TaxID=597362 RepID=K5WTU9_AGABU|nr:uncharacterized protein AGABI1DRAFT_75439 [Agaricus bisporus var. burnettii JB137-S8]EKM78866.1 hypothetical protein AGABI1DRAFT_75439 [Agaricus bisporus var. burnettii JB137-S8]